MDGTDIKPIQPWLRLLKREMEKEEILSMEGGNLFATFKGLNS